MSARLSRLLAKQRALLPVVCDEWIEVGLATEPADWPHAEHGVRLAYEAADLPAAALVVWLRSPLEGVVGGKLLRLLDSVWWPVRQVRTRVRDQVRDQALDRPLHRELVAHGVGVRRSWRLTEGLPGQHDAMELGFLDFYRRSGLRAADRLEGLMTVARAAGWWWPFRDLVMLTARRHRLCRDGDGRLHADTGPALAYPVAWMFGMGEREYAPAVKS